MTRALRNLILALVAVIVVAIGVVATPIVVLASIATQVVAGNQKGNDQVLEELKSRFDDCNASWINDARTGFEPLGAYVEENAGELAALGALVNARSVVAGGLCYFAIDDPDYEYMTGEKRMGAVGLLVTPDPDAVLKIARSAMDDITFATGDYLVFQGPDYLAGTFVTDSGIPDEMLGERIFRERLFDGHEVKVGS